MSGASEARDDLAMMPSSAPPQPLSQSRNSRRSSESEVEVGDMDERALLGLGKRPGSIITATSDRANTNPEWTTESGRSQPISFRNSLSGDAPLLRSKSNAVGLFRSAGGRIRFGSGTEGPTRQASMPSTRYARGHGWKANDSSHNNVEGQDDRPKLVSLSDLIRKEDKVPATLYEHEGDMDVLIDGRGDAAGGGIPQEALNGETVGIQHALQAAEHGNSIRLAKFLQDGGDVNTVSWLHHMRWSLLHLAAGSAMMGGRLTYANYRKRAEPDCKDGYANCVSELLAAGADPNAVSKHGGYTPLMCAAFTGSKECCWLLLLAGAQVDRKADDGRTAFKFAEKANKHVGGGGNVDGGPAKSVMAVLRDPPKKVRWRVPSQASLYPVICGDVHRYYVKVWCRGKGREVIPTKTSTVDTPRRDFCRNQTIDRGIALRKNLALPQSQTASTIVHGLQAGEWYSFTVSCTAEVEGALRQSAPSCKSKPLFIPETKEDHQWHLGGMLSMVTGNNVPSPGGVTAEVNSGQTQAQQAQQARRGQEQSPSDVESRHGHMNHRNVSWAKRDDELGASGGTRQAEGSRDGDTPPRVSFSRTMPAGLTREWDPRDDINSLPARSQSMPFVGAPSRPVNSSSAVASRLRSTQASSGGVIHSPELALRKSPLFPQTEGKRQEERIPYAGNPNALEPPRRSREPRRGDAGMTVETASAARTAVDRGYSYRGEQHPSFQDEGCIVS